MAGQRPEKAGMAVQVAYPLFEMTKILPCYKTGSLCLTMIAGIVLHLQMTDPFPKLAGLVGMAFHLHLAEPYIGMVEKELHLVVDQQKAMNLSVNPTYDLFSDSNVSK